MKDYLAPIKEAQAKRKAELNALNDKRKEFETEAERLRDVISNTTDYDTFTEIKNRLEFTENQKRITEAEINNLPPAMTDADLDALAGEMLNASHKEFKALRKDFVADYEKMKDHYNKHYEAINELERNSKWLAANMHYERNKAPGITRNAGIGLYIEQGSKEAYEARKDA